MSGRIWKKHEKRRKKAKYYARNHVGFFGFRIDRHVELWMNYHTYHGRVDTLIYRNVKYYGFTEEEAWETINGTIWEAQDKDAKEGLSYVGRYLSISAFTHGGGKKGYKKKYHSQRRNEAKKLERAVLVDDEIGFEKITPDGWKGSIGYDIW